MTQFATADLSNASVNGIPSDYERRSLDLALIAKGVASGVFVSRRSVDDVLTQSISPVVFGGEKAGISVDEDAGLVKAFLQNGETRCAKFMGDQGAVSLPLGAHQVYFQPSKIETTLPSAADTEWPMGDKAAFSPADGWDADALAHAANIPFDYEPDTYTAAFLVAHKGRIIAEKYGSGATKDMQLPSWSMGKTLTAILIGRLIEMGRLELDAPAPHPAWAKRDDPRRGITIRHLLNMTGGLDFSAAWAEDYEERHGAPDHAFMYSGAIDVFALALSRALLHEPGSFGAYKNADTLVLGAVIKHLVQEAGEDYLGWPQQNLFDLIGVRRLVLEPDPYGNLVTSGFCYGTARDWVRLGLLLLSDGVANGRRLLPAGFVDFMRSPAKGWSGKYWMAAGPDGWKDSIYGGQVWLNRYPEADKWPLPSDAFFMLGVGGQYCFIVPSMDLVVVRIGFVRGVIDNNTGREPVASALAALMSAYNGDAR
ncbi:MAG: serine hydrolase [Pseudomonadota bacterium]